MKIGIVTFYRAINYGAMLQAFALMRHLQQLGHEVEFIAHRRLITRRTPLWRCLVSKRLSSIRGRLCNYFRSSIMEFTDRFPQSLPCSTSEQLSEVAAHYDAVIVGSDQMWNPLWCSQNYLPLVMLGFVPDFVKRIAYAVSFGNNEWRADQNREEAGRLMRRFDAVSVREGRGVELVKEVSGREDALCILDPTLLFSGEQYIRLLSLDAIKQNNRGSYVFEYFLEEWTPKSVISSIERQVVETFPGLEVRSDKVPEKSIIGRMLYFLGVSTKIPVPDWVNEIRNSSFVVTNSFHGVVFSIVFHKPFAVVLLKGKMACMNDRITSLLDVLNISGRELDVSRTSDLERVKSNRISWEEVDNRVKHLKKCLNERFYSDALGER